MKLRNKKTGEIREVEPITIGGFRSLAELNSEWEDYKEPKDYWYLENNGDVVKTTYEGNLYEEKMQKIGNYFETKEEAEKAVEKLKAWKRLKDKGFRFDGWDENHHNLGIIEFGFDMVENSVWDFEKDLDLLFGGEE